MKLTISKNGLMNLLKLATPASSSKATLPVLECVRLQTAGGIISAACTNLELSILAQGIARAEIEGGICVPARQFAALIESLLGDEIQLTSDGYKLEIRCKGSRLHLNGLPIEEFPPIAAHKYEGSILKAADFIKAIKQVAFCASKEEARPTLQGIHITSKAGVMHLAGTDGFRLAITEFDCGVELNALLPAKSLQMLANLARDEEEIKVRQPDDGRVLFVGAGWQLATQLIDGNFPDVSVIIPKSFKTKVSLPAGELRAALKQIELVHAPTADITLHEKTTIFGQSEEGGQAETELEITREGPENNISFNQVYLGEVAMMMGSAVILSMNNKTSPAMISGEDPGYKVILMPMHKG